MSTPVKIFAAWNPHGLIYTGTADEAKAAVPGGEPPQVVREEDAVYECNGLVMALADSEEHRDEVVKLLREAVSDTGPNESWVKRVRDYLGELDMGKEAAPKKNSRKKKKKADTPPTNGGEDDGDDPNAEVTDDEDA